MNILATCYNELSQSEHHRRLSCVRRPWFHTVLCSHCSLFSCLPASTWITSPPSWHISHLLLNLIHFRGGGSGGGDIHACIITLGPFDWLTTSCSSHLLRVLFRENSAEGHHSFIFMLMWPHGENVNPPAFQVIWCMGAFICIRHEKKYFMLLQLIYWLGRSQSRII